MSDPSQTTCAKCWYFRDNQCHVQIGQMDLSPAGELFTGAEGEEDCLFFLPINSEVVDCFAKKGCPMNCEDCKWCLESYCHGERILLCHYTDKNTANQMAWRDGHYCPLYRT